MNGDNENKEELKAEEAKSSDSKVEAAYVALPKKGGKNFTPYIIAVLVVMVILGGILYKLESEGRSSTKIFSSLIESSQANKPAATVNGVEIKNSDLNLSIKQFEQAASIQGVDVTDPQVRETLNKQALEVLINTEMLKQEAERQGLTVTDEEVSNRITEIETQVGDRAVLQERMDNLGIDDNRLRQDVHGELLVQKLLDKKFSEANIQVTDEEVLEFYQSIGAATQDLPPLEEVKDQIFVQIRTSKEQQVVDTTIAELKAISDIQIL